MTTIAKEHFAAHQRSDSLRHWAYHNDPHYKAACVKFLYVLELVEKALNTQGVPEADQQQVFTTLLGGPPNAMAAFLRVKRHSEHVNEVLRLTPEDLVYTPPGPAT